MKETGLARQYQREKIFSKAVQFDELKNYLTNVKPNLAKTAVAVDTVLQNTLSYFSDTKSGVIRGIIPAAIEIKNIRIIAGYGTKTNIRVAKKLGDLWRRALKMGKKVVYQKCRVLFFQPVKVA